MNQTKKRLSIINLAISITDIETIRLQMLKLELLKSDTKIQEILTVLHAENYAMAQRLIGVYIDTPVEEIVQRVSQQEPLNTEEVIPTTRKDTIFSDEDQKIIEEFQLFTTGIDNRSTIEKKKDIDVNDYLTDAPHTSKTEVDTQAKGLDALLNMEADEVMPNNIKIDISQDPNDAFFDTYEKEERATLHTEHVARDTFFDIDEPEETATKEVPADDPFDSLLTVETDTEEAFIKDDLSEQSLQETSAKEEETSEEITTITADSSLEEQLLKKTTEPEAYPPISYIRQKFVSMKKQYEPIQKGNARFPTVETFLTTISQEGYKEKEIEETLVYVEKLITEQKFAEASQLLLLCASTESSFAQLMLARELYRGVLLRKKVSEAFYILTHMADENYPEALCDLGQFYENGIGTDRDKKVAKELYKQAMDLGIKRAGKHYERMKKQTKGFLSSKP